MKTHHYIEAKWNLLHKLLKVKRMPTVEQIYHVNKVSHLVLNPVSEIDLKL